MKTQSAGKPGMTIAEAKEQLLVLAGILKSIDGFKIGPQVTAPTARMAEAVRGGNYGLAITEAEAALDAGYNIAGAFIRRSVEDYTKNDLPTQSRFNREIAMRDDANMHEDLIARLVSKREDLLEAVRQETGREFGKRVTAYNTMVAVLAEVDDDQAQRDRLGLKADSFKTGRRGRREERMAANGETSRAAARAQLIEQQGKMADELATIF